MKTLIRSIVSVFVLNLSYISATSDLTSPAAPLLELTIQYKWYDSAENRSKGIAPQHFISSKHTATHQFQRVLIPVFFDSDKSVSEILDLIKAVLGIPRTDLKVRIGISRKDRVTDIPFTKMQQTKLIKARYAPPRNEDE